MKSLTKEAKGQDECVAITLAQRQIPTLAIIIGYEAIKRDADWTLALTRGVKYKPSRSDIGQNVLQKNEAM